MVPLNSSLMLQSVQVEVNEINLITKRNRIPHTDTAVHFFGDIVSDDMGGERARESSEESRRSLLSERGVFVVKGCTVPVTTSSL